MSELITKDMPEPRFDGYVKLLVIDPRDGALKTVLQCYGENDWVDFFWSDGGCYTSWEEIRKNYSGAVLETLAEHDSRIEKDVLHSLAASIYRIMPKHGAAGTTIDPNADADRRALKSVVAIINRELES